MNIFNILISCDSLVQNTLCPLSWNFSYQNVGDFKEAEWKMLCMRCWTNGNDRRKADDIFTYFSEYQTKYFTQRSSSYTEDIVYSTCQETKMPMTKGWLEQEVPRELLLGYHHPGKKMPSNSIQKLSCQGLETPPETTADIDKHIGLSSLPEDLSKFRHVSWKFVSKMLRVLTWITK